MGSKLSFGSGEGNSVSADKTAVEFTSIKVCFEDNQSAGLGSGWLLALPPLKWQRHDSSDHVGGLLQPKRIGWATSATDCDTRINIAHRQSRDVGEEGHTRHLTEAFIVWEATLVFE